MMGRAIVRTLVWAAMVFLFVWPEVVFAGLPDTPPQRSEAAEAASESSQPEEASVQEGFPVEAEPWPREKKLVLTLVLTVAGVGGMWMNLYQRGKK